MALVDGGQRLMADSSQPPTRRITQSSNSKGLVIQGHLEDTPLPETVQFLQSLRKTGQLALERSDPRQSAGIGFIDGRVVHAFCPPLSGEACFHQLLTWRSGRYIFFHNAPAREHSISVDTNTLLLDGMRRLDELARCLGRLPPRSSVLHRRRDRVLLRTAMLTFPQIRLWRRLDGRATVGEILDTHPDSAHILVELVSSGLAAPSPDHRFLTEITLAHTVHGAGQLDGRAVDLAAQLLLACDGHRSLAEALHVLGCPPEELIAAAEYLLARRLVQVVRGAEAAELLA